MKRRMAVVTGEGKVEMIYQELPVLPSNEALIKVHASLISPGTEMNLVKHFRANPDLKCEPKAFGYAIAGEIMEVNGNYPHLKPGMRVAAMGAGAASHADFVNVPVNLICPIPAEVSYHDATYACLGATALHAVRRGAPQLGEFGLVLGLGIVGNLAMQLGSISGARMMAWEGLSGRREIAAACGIKHMSDPFAADAAEQVKAFTAPYGLDFAVFAFGGNGTKAFEQVRSCMKVSADGHQMGRLVLVGGCSIDFIGAAASGNIDILSAARTGAGYHDANWEHGANYPAAFVQFTTTRNLDDIVRLIAEKRLTVAPMTTHVMPLAEVGKAAEMLIDTPDQAMGIILDMA